MLGQISQWIRQDSGLGWPMLSRWEARTKLGGPRAIPWPCGSWVGSGSILSEDGKCSWMVASLFGDLFQAAVGSMQGWGHQEGFP